MFNEVTLIGRLGKNPELRETQSKKSVCNLWMVTSEISMKDGTRKETTEWHAIVAWDKIAEHCFQYLHKGSLIFVKGKIATREYTDKDGTKKKQVEIIAHTVKFLESKKDSQQVENGTVDRTIAARLDVVPITLQNNQQTESSYDIPW